MRHCHPAFLCAGVVLILCASEQPFPISFTDVAPAAGLTSPIVCGDDVEKTHIIEANGTGLAFLDLDDDGWPDIFLVNASRFGGFPDSTAPTNHLYRNSRDGKFEDITAGSGLARTGWGNGVCAGDFDNDGLEDLYVTYWGPNSLFRNLGGGRFMDVAQRSGTEGPPGEWSTGCTFLDYDRDGHLDLFVTSYQAIGAESLAPSRRSSGRCEWNGLQVFCGPRGFPYGAVTLYHNLGNGRFEDVSGTAGIRAGQRCYAFTAVAADLDGDGWTDLYVACDSSASLLFRNRRNGTFWEVAMEAGVALNEHGYEQGGMGIAVGDYDNDGRLDIIKTNFVHEPLNLYRGIGKGLFADMALPAGLFDSTFVAWGIGLEDFDNDGRRDLLQVNGHVYTGVDALRNGQSYRNRRSFFHGR